MNTQYPLFYTQLFDPIDEKSCDQLLRVLSNDNITIHITKENVHNFGTLIHQLTKVGGGEHILTLKIKDPTIDISALIVNGETYKIQCDYFCWRYDKIHFICCQNQFINGTNNKNCKLETTINKHHFIINLSNFDGILRLYGFVYENLSIKDLQCDHLVITSLKNIHIKNIISANKITINSSSQPEEEKLIDTLANFKVKPKIFKIKNFCEKIFLLCDNIEKIIIRYLKVSHIKTLAKWLLTRNTLIDLKLQCNIDQIDKYSKLYRLVQTITIEIFDNITLDYILSAIVFNKKHNNKIYVQYHNINNDTIIQLKKWFPKNDLDITYYKDQIVLTSSEIQDGFFTYFRQKNNKKNKSLYDLLLFK